MPRIPMLSPEEIDPMLRDASGVPISKASFFRVMAHAPTAYAGLRPFTRAIFSQLSLDPKDRELVVLLVADMQGGEYQWAQHLEIGKAVGLTEEQIEAVRLRAFDTACISPRQAALLRFAEQVIANVRCDDETFQRVAGHYDNREIVETLFTIGNYMMLARISEVAQVPIDDQGIVSWRSAQPK